ncbi:MAG: hypothetical protein KC635_22625 [Myxococcales bacterium]|nr:hypothetical protein [Myxococcales bacterium]MCB9733453.1 hypothetical protein [Deltaproteobacteria bacterium]
MRAVVIPIAFVAASLAAQGCGSGPESKEGKSPEAKLLGLDITGDKEVENFDLNGDNKADDWKTYVFRGPEDAPREKKVRLLAKHELDLDFDGRPDVVRVFNDQGAVVTEQMDLDFDGKPDAIDYYADGVLYRRDLALDFAGKASIVKFYNDNQLTRKERDTNGDGKMDTIEYYEGGKLMRIGEDRDGDGKPDVYTEVNEGS